MTDTHGPLANDLDRVRIRDWRERLRKARWADGDGWHRAYDREWREIVAEYRTAVALEAVATANLGGHE